MKTNPTITQWLTVLAFSIISLSTSTAFAQGSLSPPGAPAPTMKSLDQIEARTPISSAPYTISSSGSYYLTTNFTVTTGTAISINVSGVTLDLNGFTISSTAASANGTGILLASGLTDITILNGHIMGGVTYSGGSYSGGGLANGIYYSGTTPANVRVSGVSVSGCLGQGIYLGTGNSTVVDSCTVQTVGGYGIDASSVTHSTAYQCGNTAITGDSASDCYGYCTGSGFGLVANNANNCCGLSSSGRGLFANNANNCSGQGNGSVSGLVANNANNCSGVSSNGNGLSAYNTATGCYGQSTGSGTGLYANNANNCYGLSGSGTGLSAQFSSNCYGESDGSGIGLSANNASNCQGNSQSGTGLSAQYTANTCSGYSASGTGLSATIANSCWAIKGGVTATYKYNMP